MLQQKLLSKTNIAIGAVIVAISILINYFRLPPTTTLVFWAFVAASTVQVSSCAGLFNSNKWIVFLCLVLHTAAVFARMALYDVIGESHRNGSVFVFNMFTPLGIWFVAQDDRRKAKSVEHDFDKQIQRLLEENKRLMDNHSHHTTKP